MKINYLFNVTVYFLVQNQISKLNGRIKDDINYMISKLLPINNELV
jgi:hypothetical protein